jgi:AAA15 family ATPase/GTPase
MLVEFRAANFRSVRDELTLSLVASKDKTSRNTHTMPTGVSAVPHLLRSAAIYGANASGKSNVLKALQYMRGVVLESASLVQPGQTYAVQPFRLDPAYANKPTEFEVTFLIDGVRYQYGFAMTSERITSEHLLVYKAFKPQRWFERYYDVETGKDHFEFGSGLKGPKSVWEQATRPNALFLSMAVQLNSEALRPIFEWFARKLVVFNDQAPLTPQPSLQRLKDRERRSQIRSFLASADISIADIDVITSTVPGQAVHFDLTTGTTELRTEQIEQNRLLFRHVTAAGEAVFDLSEESSGTQSLLFLSGPVLDALENGLVLVVDELDTSLHTLLVRELVRLFNSPATNRYGAQLIFTTHDTSLLDADLFRRDQIWLVEKDSDQASVLLPLSDFSPRKGEALERGYLAGRYGGVPFIADALSTAH